MRSRCPLKLGLTGALASGKSTALKAFKKQGWKTWSADEAVQKIYDQKGLTKERLLKRFGTEASGLRKLENWIHPLVAQDLKKLIGKTRKPLVAEVPLLFEAGFESYFDWTVAVVSSNSARRARAVKRGMKAELFKALDRRQWSAKRKSEAADFILRNTSKKALRLRVKNLARILEELAKRK